MNAREQVRQAVIETVIKAREVYKVQVPLPHVRFSNKMTRCAGTYTYSPFKFPTHTVTFSLPIIMNNDINEFCADTVIHEVAHYVDRLVNDGRGHNARFYNVMRRLGHKNPTRCHNFKTVSNRKTFPYKCAECGKTFEFTKVRHNKVLGGATYTHSCDGRYGIKGKVVPA